MSDPIPQTPAQAPHSKPPAAGKTVKTGRARKPASGGRPVHPLLHRLWQLHPQLFGARFLPLKVGIFEDLMARHPGAFSQDELKQALAQHVRSTRYLEAVAQGQPRHDLEAQAVDPVAPEHVLHAIGEILRRRQGRDPVAARAWGLARLVEAFVASGEGRDEWQARLPARDTDLQALADEAWAEVAAHAARREALLRAYRASGQTPEAFAEMYGLPPAQVHAALAHEAAAAASAATR
jgi:ProP effector